MGARRCLGVLLAGGAIVSGAPAYAGAAADFTGPTDFAGGPNPAGLVLVDVNGDPLIDLATANSGSADGSDGVSVLRNTTTSSVGPPTFAAPLFLDAGPNPVAIAAGDLNGDFRPDLAIANGGSAGGANGVSVLLSTAGFGATAPSFSGPTNFAAGASPASIAIGDLNKDGRADLAIANGGSAGGANGVSVLLNTTPDWATTPTFAGPTHFNAGPDPASIAIGEINRDFDGDGSSRPDIVVANSGSDNGADGVSVLLNTTADGGKTPGFSGPTNFATGDNPASVALSDLDGNTPFRLDIATANSGSEDGTDGVSVLFNNNPSDGAATPSFGAPTHFDAGDEPAAIAASGSLDFEENVDDLVTANRGSASGTAGISILSNASSGGTATFTGQVDLDAGANPAAVTTGDLTGDGLLEVVTANSGSGSGADGISVQVTTMPPDGRTSPACTDPPGGTQTSWSSTRAVGELRRDTTEHVYATRVLARGPGGEVVFDQTTPDAPESAAVAGLFEEARGALQQRFGSDVTVSDPTLDSSSITNGPDVYVGTFLIPFVSTTTTTTVAIGPGTILVGPEQSLTLFIEDNCSNLNTNVHYQQFADEVHRVIATHDATYSLSATRSTSPPSNAFSLGKLKRNKKKGTAKLTVTVPGPGTLALSGNGLKAQRPSVAGAGSTKLAIKATGRKRKKLKRKGKVKLKASVAFTPTGGTQATLSKKLKLKRKRKR